MLTGSCESTGKATAPQHVLDADDQRRTLYRKLVMSAQTLNLEFNDDIQGTGAVTVSRCLLPELSVACRIASSGHGHQEQGRLNC